MIGLKGIFANRSPFFHIGVFAYFLLMGFLMSATCVFFIMKAGKDSAGLSFYLMHTTQFVANIFLFLLPAFGTAYICSRHPAGFLFLKKKPNSKVLLLTVLMLFLIIPLVDLTTYINLKLQLPEFMAPVENWMRATEDSAAKLIEKMLSEEGILPFITNIFNIGVMAGVTEELLFRGTLLSIIRKRIKNPHIAIWMVAMIFSAIHLQFYGFIPRMILGAVLGYMLYWSHSIWVPVLAHFLNNTIIVIANKAGFFSDKVDNSTFIPAEPSPQELILICVISIACLTGFYFCAKVMQRWKG